MTPFESRLSTPVFRRPFERNCHCSAESVAGSGCDALGVRLVGEVRSVRTAALHPVRVSAAVRTPWHPEP